MATTPEGKVKAKVVKLLKERGVYYFFPATFGYGVSGLFDIVACVGGYFIGIEVKAASNKLPTALQTRNAMLAKTAGAVVLLLHNGNVGVLDQVLTEIENERPPRFDGKSVWSP